MIKYNAAKDELHAVNKRGEMVKVGARSRKRIPLLVEYVCGELAQGKSRTEIIPKESKVFPPMIEFLDVLNSQEYKTLYGKAENVRLRLLHEKFIGVINALSRDPDDKAKHELIKALTNAMRSIEKAGGMKENIVIQFNQNFPEDMWS